MGEQMGRVLVVSHEASRTGAPRMAVHVLSVLAAAGWEVVLCHRWGGQLEAEMDRVVETAPRPGRVVHEPGRRVRVALRRAGRPRTADRVGLLAARRVVRRARPDVVVANTTLSSVYVRAATEQGVPAVLYSHELGSMAAYGLAAAGVVRDGRFDGTTQAPVLAACSTAAAGALAAACDASAGSVVVLPGCVDAEALAERARRGAPATWQGSVVLACGTANPTKGADVFLGAARLHRASGGTARWVWVGEAADAPPDPDGDVEWFGLVEDVAPLIARADVVVVPSRSDSFPLAALEAMALARPVVASEVGGLPEQLADTGVLVPVADPDAVQRAVATLLDDPARRAALGAAASERCRAHWSVAAFAGRLSALVSRAVAERPHPR